MEKIGQVVKVDEVYIENLISKHGSIGAGKFENRPLSEYEHDRRVAFEKKHGLGWVPDYTGEELFPMYVEKCPRSGDRIVFGNTREYGGHEDGQTVYHHYRWLIEDYGKEWRMREIITTEYDYSKAIDLFKR